MGNTPVGSLGRPYAEPDLKKTPMRSAGLLFGLQPAGPVSIVPALFEPFRTEAA
jgi:hypothetical protein